MVVLPFCARNKDFADAQTGRQEKHTALMTDFAKELAERNSEFSREIVAAAKNSKDALDDLRSKHEASALSVLDKINSHKLEVEKLVGVIGNLGVTSGYLNTANHMRNATYLWQAATVASLVVLIVVAYLAFLPVVNGTFTWEGFAGRVFLSLTVGVLAAYAAHQADKARENERRNRKLALELEAIGPYLAPLEKADQDKFRIEMGNRSFGQPDSISSLGKDKSPATVADILKSAEFRKLLVDTVETAVKK